MNTRLNRIGPFIYTIHACVTPSFAVILSIDYTNDPISFCSLSMDRQWLISVVRNAQYEQARMF